MLLVVKVCCVGCLDISKADNFLILRPLRGPETKVVPTTAPSGEYSPTLRRRKQRSRFRDRVLVEIAKSNDRLLRHHGSQPMAPQQSKGGNGNSRWYCEWECSACTGPDGFPQRNRADAKQCRKCKKSYFYMWGKDTGTAKLLRNQPDSDAAKTIEKVEKQVQALKAELKAAKEGKPTPSSEEPSTANTKDDAAEDDTKENLEKAKLSLKGLQDMSDSAKEMFGMEVYNERLAQAKLQVENATKAKFKGQPIDAQLRGAKTRMEHTKQALEHKKSAQQKAQHALEEAQKRVQAADQAVTDMAAKLETQKLELSQLQHQSAQELAGNDDFQNPILSTQITNVLQEPKE